VVVRLNDDHWVDSGLLQDERFLDVVGAQLPPPARTKTVIWLGPTSDCAGKNDVVFIIEAI